MAVPATIVNFTLMMTGNQAKYQITRHLTLKKMDYKSNNTEPNANIIKILGLTNLYDVKLAETEK